VGPRVRILLPPSGESATNQAIEVQAGHPGGSAVFKLFATQPCLRSLSFEKLCLALFAADLPEPTAQKGDDFLLNLRIIQQTQ
jgi:hypothetical protein